MQLKQKTVENVNPGDTPRVFESDPDIKELVAKAAALKVDPFLGAEALEVSERQRTALIKTLQLMESHGINHDDFIEGRRFTMSRWVENGYLYQGNYCGTVCCIGGTASILDGGPYVNPRAVSIFHNAEGASTCKPALENLFYHWGGVEVTVERAAKQLRVFLETGKCPPRWAEEK